ncbi:MAG: DNA-directed DNA polymerase [Candidatus Marsarchaeota archaeon]|nr:DNA-directed DNA polymerase [Candidatus Marsarchaeota archaeon]
MSTGDTAQIRLTVKGSDGKAYDIFDADFKPYFVFVPSKEMKKEEMMELTAFDGSSVIKPTNVEGGELTLFGKKANSYKVYTRAPIQVPKLADSLLKFGNCYEYDIPFAKRYMLNSGLFPFTPYSIQFKDDNGRLSLVSIKKIDEEKKPKIDTNLLCFDIEVYNPLVITRPDTDPVIMISYSYVANGKTGKGVITYKNIEKEFVEVVENEKAMIKRFVQIVNDLDIDIITGYNSANFDIRYLSDRSRRLGLEFDLGRFVGGTRIERHGLVDRVKISGRVHVDAYLVTRFVATVGASERILKLNSYTLKNVYEAISPGKKVTVEKKFIWKLWDGSSKELEELATYNLNDSDALMEVYNTVTPIVIELSKVTGDMLTDVAVSTPGQLVEFTLMRYAQEFNEIIPNKPNEMEMKVREANPIEGAYVKTPDPGIYSNLAIFDFRGMYPSIIISHNIDPSSICAECEEYYESPIGTKFDKKRKSVMPVVLKLLIDQRSVVKKLFKKDPGNIELGARTTALKIVSNSFYGYLGYARSRYYSRDCAASVTAYGRQYIQQTIADSEAFGLRVLYSDTDSIVVLLENHTKDEAIEFMKGENKKLPESMELELEDFYTRGVFVGKKTEKGVAGAKKKYALIAESGRIKIRGFELVRRDWSKIARETQRRVLETILKEGSKDSAAAIVRNVIDELREGKVPISELVINTQLRKGIDSYDTMSPEVAAAKKAVQRGQKTRDEVEHSLIGYVVTRHGTSVSERAELEEFAKDYDPDYYINHQVLPATMRILKELDFTEEELKNKGKQSRL